MLVYEYWYNFAKPEHGDGRRRCYTASDNFIVHMKSENKYGVTRKDVTTRFNTLGRLEGKKHSRIKIQHLQKVWTSQVDIWLVGTPSQLFVKES